MQKIKQQNFYPNLNFNNGIINQNKYIIFGEGGVTQTFVPQYEHEVKNNKKVHNENNNGIINQNKYIIFGEGGVNQTFVSQYEQEIQNNKKVYNEHNNGIINQNKYIIFGEGGVNQTFVPQYEQEIQSNKKVNYNYENKSRNNYKGKNLVNEQNINNNNNLINQNNVDSKTAFTLYNPKKENLLKSFNYKFKINNQPNQNIKQNYSNPIKNNSLYHWDKESKINPNIYTNNIQQNIYQSNINDEIYISKTNIIINPIGTKTINDNPQINNNIHSNYIIQSNNMIKNDQLNRQNMIINDLNPTTKQIINHHKNKYNLNKSQNSNKQSNIYPLKEAFKMETCEIYNKLKYTKDNMTPIPTMNQEKNSQINKNIKKNAYNKEKYYANIHVNTKNNSKKEPKFPIIFRSIDHSIIRAINCKDSDNFTKIEQKLFEEYPELKNKKIYYIYSGNIIDRNRTIKENNLKDNAQILINFQEQKSILLLFMAKKFIEININYIFGIL